jgi:hypothetical protein
MFVGWWPYPVAVSTFALAKLRHVAIRTTGFRQDAAGTPPTMSDPTEAPEAHNAAEDLDEDRLQADPLEAGMDPPEHWSPAIDHDDAEPAGLDERLREEEPDRTLPE